MIEIVLRKDIADYEARPLFGFTYRQVLTAAAIVGAGAILGVGLTLIGVPNTIMSIVVLAVGGAIGFVGLGHINGLKFEVWFRFWNENRQWKKVALFSAPVLSPYGDRKPSPTAKEKINKVEKKRIEEEKTQALLECEVINDL